MKNNSVTTKNLKKKTKVEHKTVVTYHDIKISLDTHHLETILQTHMRMLEVELEAIRQTKINAHTLLNIEKDSRVEIMNAEFVGGKVAINVQGELTLGGEDD